jgi:transposase-like protein
LLICFDPVTFDVIDVIWREEENEEGYSLLIDNVLKKVPKDKVLGIYGDGDLGLISTIKQKLGNIPFQLCIVHKELRMGQLVPVKRVHQSNRMDEKVKIEIIEFQKLFREIIYAESKEKSFKALEELKKFTDKSNQERFKKAYRALNRNFKYTLTHFDHPDMDRDNNLIECFNGCIKPRLDLMKGFKKENNIDRYIKLFFLEFRFRPLRESRFKEIRGLSPLENGKILLPEMFNFLTYLRKEFNINFT